MYMHCIFDIPGDSIRHSNQVLFNTIENMGIRNNCLLLFRNFQCEHKQCVKINTPIANLLRIIIACSQDDSWEILGKS